jgi:hypothetical protein
VNIEDRGSTDRYNGNINFTTMKSDTKTNVEKPLQLEEKKLHENELAHTSSTMRTLCIKFSLKPLEIYNTLHQFVNRQQLKGKRKYNKRAEISSFLSLSMVG